MQTINDKVARHLLIYLTVQKWLVGDVPFYLRFWIKVSHPVQKTVISIRLC